MRKRLEAVCNEQGRRSKNAMSIPHAGAGRQGRRKGSIRAVRYAVKEGRVGLACILQRGFTRAVFVGGSSTALPPRAALDPPRNLGGGGPHSRFKAGVREGAR